MKAILHILVLSTLLAASHLLMKSAALNTSKSMLGFALEEWPRISTALALYGGVFAYYLLLLRKFDLAVIYPAYTALSLILVVIFSSLVFQERLGTQQLLGVALATTGVFMITSK